MTLVVVTTDRDAACATGTSGILGDRMSPGKRTWMYLQRCRKYLWHALSHWCLGLLLLCAGAAHAAIDPYTFEDEVQRERYQRFIAELRCPKCQNQNLSGSDAPIAADLRRELHRLIVEGRSDREIVDFMVGRYGEFVLYRPPLDSRTVVLWAAPAVLLLIGAIAIALIVRRHRTAAVATPLDAAERKRLQALLREADRAPGRDDSGTGKR